MFNHIPLKGFMSKILVRREIVGRNDIGAQKENRICQIILLNTCEKDHVHFVVITYK